MPITSIADLQTFVAIVDAGSFTAAARRQGLTVNAVSRRLQQLEDGLGTKLLERTTRRTAPTDAGRRLREKAGAVLDALLVAEAEVQRSELAIEGLVRVALPPAIVTAALLRGLERLMAEQPRLRVDLRIGAPLLPGEAGVDLSVLVTPPPATHGLIARRIALRAWGLAAAPSYASAHGLPRTPERLSEHACLRFSGEAPQRTWTITGPRDRRVTVNVDGGFQCDDSRVLGDALYAGLGVGLRPEGEIEEGVRRGSLVRVLPGWRFEARPAYLVTTQSRRRIPRVSKVSELVAATLRDFG